MHDKKDVLIFPYDLNFAPLLRWRDFKDMYNKIYLSSVIGWGLCGNDASYADGGPEIKILIQDKFEEYLEKCDLVIFVEPDNYINYEQSLYPKIYNAINAGKDIVCLLDLGEKVNEIQNYCDDKNVKFTYFKDLKSEMLKNDLDLKREYGILDIDKPIIAINGVAENTNKFHLQLQVKSLLEEIGYKVTLISSRTYGEFFGIVSFPEFMFDKNISEVEKIYMFNRFVKHIELTHDSDVILIGVPGGIMQYNNQIDNNFGVVAFEVFQAITPDASILSIYHEMYTDEFFNMLENSVKYRLGFNIDAINVVNKQIDWVEMINANPHKISLLSLNSEFLNERIKECENLTNIPLYNSIEEKNAKMLVKLLIDILSQNESAIIV